MWKGRDRDVKLERNGIGCARYRKGMWKERDVEGIGKGCGRKGMWKERDVEGKVCGREGMWKV